MAKIIVLQNRPQKENGKQRLGIFRVFSPGMAAAQTRTRCPNHIYIKVRVGGKCPRCGWPETKK